MDANDTPDNRNGVSYGDIGFAELHNLLLSRGHSVWSDVDYGKQPTDVWPTPDDILTVGVEPDATLVPAYRSNYFTCRRDVSDTALIEYDRDYAFPDAVARLLQDGAIRSNDFLQGPMRWLFVQLNRHGQVRLWPKKGPYLIEDGWQFGDTEMRDLSVNIKHLVGTARCRETRGPVSLDLKQGYSQAILAEVGSYVGRSHRDFYLADMDGAEVYMMHHHDKVVVSIPDAHRRDMMIAQLRRNGQLFEDCSGFACESDSDMFNTAD